MKNQKNYDDKNEENKLNLEEFEKEELKQFDIQLKKYAHHHKMYKRILAVKMVKSGETRIKVGEYLNVNRQTVGRWVRAYDESGFEGLEPDYSNCGAESRLTNKQYAEILEKITDPEEHYDIKRTRKFIRDEYDIDYSYKQVWVIVREKLNLNYRKPYLRFNESPEDAEEQFKKKTSKIDLENEDTAVLDESRAQNEPNTGRRLCNPTIDGIKDPNLATRTGKRFGINATGIQGINCKSAIYFNHRNNAVNFSINLCEYSTLRFKNPIVIKKVSNAINDPDLDETNIKLKFLLPVITKKEHKALIDEKGNINFKKLKSLCKKYKINYYKINKIRKEILIKNLSDKKLMEMIKNERKLNLIMDNAQIHKAEVTKIVADILNINIIYLPVYSPFLNPIEKVWADIKRELYKEYYKSVEDIIKIFRSEFYKIVDNKSYTENWLNKFFDINSW